MVGWPVSVSLQRMTAGHVVDLNGNVQRLTENDSAGWGVAIFSSNGTRMLYADGSDQRQMIPDDRHTGTLEYFDW
jgi:hypothetical protein